MIKKTTFLLVIMFTVFVNSVFASVVTSYTYDSTNDRYVLAFDSFTVSKVLVEHWDSQNADTSTPPNKTKEFSIIEGYGEIYVNCNNTYKFSFFNSSNSLIETLVKNNTQVVNEGCNTEYTPPDDGGAGGDCIGCDLFNCPGWGDYMGKIDQVIGKIPPPPDWNNVADIMTNTIVPRLINDMENMLGSAPSPPPAPAPIAEPARPNIPAQPAPIDISTNEPEMLDIPGLEGSGFDKSKIENEAPVIEFNEDPTGGFEISDPIDALPDMPTDNFPIPGQTDAGEWEQYKPPEIENSFPMPPGGGNGTIDPPLPGGDSGGGDIGNEPPIPGGENTGGGEPPIPSGSGEGGGEEFDWSTEYKNHPDDPDGSG